MNFNDIARVLPALLDTPHASIELQSPPGVGKSEFVEQLIEEYSRRDGFEWGFATCFLATMTPSDLMGYMVPSKMRVGDRMDALVSEFTLPPWMLTRDGRTVFDFKRGILFLDEFGQGEADVKRAAAELLRAGRLGNHELPPGWSVVAASNRAQDRSGVTKTFDFIIDRKFTLEVTPDPAAWEVWAMRRGVHPSFVYFAMQNTQIVFAGTVPDKQGPWCTPRGLVQLEAVLRRMAGHDQYIPDGPLMLELACSRIGEAAATQLFACLRLEKEMPRFEDIVKDPVKCKLPARVDAQMLAAFHCAGQVTKETMAPVVTYIERMPQEFAPTFMRQTVARDSNLVMTGEIRDWAKRNASLMAVLAPRK